MNNIISSPSNNGNHHSSSSPIFNGTGGLFSPQTNGSNFPVPNSSVANNINEQAITDLHKKLVLYGYIFLFLFGYFGHISTIIIFLRPTLRSVSTSCLFICVTISNILYLSVCIYDFLYTGLGLMPIDSQTNPDFSNALCRFRSFIQSVAMCSSAWLLVTISIDRWIRIRFPFKVNKLCTRNRALFGALIVLICAIILNSHLLSPSLGTLSGVTICGAISSSKYSYFFREIWGILLACLQIILPTIFLLILTIDMFIRLRRRQKQKQRLILGHPQHFVSQQMLIIMLTSIFLFFSTQIPLSLFNILLSPVLKMRLSESKALDLTSFFDYIASINYSTTFYVHCLTSGLFRKEFCNTLRCCLRNRNKRVGIMPQIKIIEATKNQTSQLKERKFQPLPSIKQ